MMDEEKVRGKNWHSQLPSALGGTINLELWETDEALRLLILQREDTGVQPGATIICRFDAQTLDSSLFTSSFMYQYRHVSFRMNQYFFHFCEK